MQTSRRLDVIGPPGNVRLVMPTLAEIERTALRLPETDRLHLVDKLLGSLPSPPAVFTDDEILAEAISRDAELESGHVPPLSEAAFRKGVRRSAR
ncbi:Putative addiction module component [Opitutaceae bacterium TAV1]|nr:Putative addiction module component [Opitutaceae bacterium TAV1]